jgi:hypothetical protein
MAMRKCKFSALKPLYIFITIIIKRITINNIKAIEPNPSPPSCALGLSLLRMKMMRNERA